MLALALVVALATVPHQTLTRLLDGLLIRRSLAVMLLLFGLLGLSLLWTDGQNLDAAVFLRINVMARTRATSTGRWGWPRNWGT